MRRLLADPYVGGATWLLSERVVRLLAELLAWILLARYLGPTGLGVISFSQGLAALLIPFVHLGLDNFVMLDITRKQGAADEIVGTALLLKFLGGLLSYGLFVAVVLLSVDEPTTQVVAVIVGATLLFHFGNVFELYFLSVVSNRPVAIAKFVSVLFSLCSKIAIVLLELPIVWVGVSLAADILFQTALLWFVYGRAGALRIDRALAVSLLRRSWPLILSGLTIAIYMKSDLVMLKYLVDEAEVGVYSAAARISESIYFVPMIVASVFFPGIIKAKEESAQLYEARLGRLFSMLGSGAVIVALGFTITAAWIVGILYGAEYSDAAAVLRLHAWAALSVFVGVVRSKWMASEGLQLYDLALNVAGALINVVMNFLLIPDFGAFGAAAATLVSYFATTLLLPWFVPELRRITGMMLRSYFSMPVLVRELRRGVVPQDRG